MGYIITLPFRHIGDRAPGRTCMQLDEVTADYVRHHGRNCAIATLRWWQALWYAALFSGLAVMLAWRWDITLCVVIFVLSLAYLTAALFRFTAVGLSALGLGQRRVPREQLARLRDEDLPVYTVMVPLYREANIADRIVRNLEALDYPKSRLDLKLLLEEDDLETLRAVRDAGLPEDRYDIVIVPDFLPKTKPRACNFGLRRARGEFCVVYDAEDRPEPDQLRKAVRLFRDLPPHYACIQAKLNYYNSGQNLLTRWFTVEYLTNFSLFLPGLELLGVPIPLGGTSNHFRTAVLRELGGWDPFNVTEDCELGVRIFVRGYRTCLLDSTTWEEANSRPGNWLRQRSRWVKGYCQTHFAHLRNPWRTLRELGIWGMTGFLLSVGGSALMMLANVAYWLIALLYAVLLVDGLGQGWRLWDMIHGPQPPGPLGRSIFGIWLKPWPLIYSGPGEHWFWSRLSLVFFAVGITLLLANLLFVATHVLACLKTRHWRLLPTALLMPAYWVLISLGAWRGLGQLCTNPFFWEKTRHGLDAVPE